MNDISGTQILALQLKFWTYILNLYAQISYMINKKFISLLIEFLDYRHVVRCDAYVRFLALTTGQFDDLYYERVVQFIKV